MDPSLNKSTDTGMPPGVHAHLLVAETGGLVTLDSPAAVMAEVAFRTSHISALMEEMFEESSKHDTWWKLAGE